MTDKAQMVRFETLEIGQVFRMQIGFRSVCLRKVDLEYAENVNAYLKIGKHCLVTPIQSINSFQPPNIVLRSKHNSRKAQELPGFTRKISKLREKGSQAG